MAVGCGMNTERFCKIKKIKLMARILPADNFNLWSLYTRVQNRRAMRFAGK